MLLPGALADEVLISCHVCHPSICTTTFGNRAVRPFLAKQLQNRRLRYSYRFVSFREPFGAITWLSRNEATASRVKHAGRGNVGDSGKMHYKKSRRGDAEIRPRGRPRAHEFRQTTRSSISRPTATTSASTAPAAFDLPWLAHEKPPRLSRIPYLGGRP